MGITKELFVSYLNCQTKSYLKNWAISPQPTKFELWQRSLENNLQRQGVDALKEQARRKALENPTEAELTIKGPALYVNCSIEAGEMMSLIDGVEKIESPGAKTQWIPYRCVLSKRVERHEKLLLAYDALCLKAFTEIPIRVGKLVDRVSKRAKKVQLNSLVKTAQDHIRRLAELLRQEKEPPLILNKHCIECEFRARCREKAMEMDDLSLLSKMSLKERQKLHGKGIFTVTQLSYTFRPRRRRKSLRANTDNFSYPLRALAIREKKIHVAGTPIFTIQDNDCFWTWRAFPIINSIISLGYGFVSTAKQSNIHSGRATVATKKLCGMT
jgi:predicted RecB family nuclease